MYTEKWNRQVKKKLRSPVFVPTISKSFCLCMWRCERVSLVHFDGPMMNQIKNIKCFSGSFFSSLFALTRVQHPQFSSSFSRVAHILFYSHSFLCVIEFICSVESQSQQHQPKKKLLYSKMTYILSRFLLKEEKKEVTEKKLPLTHIHTYTRTHTHTRESDRASEQTSKAQKCSATALWEMERADNISLKNSKNKVI